MSHSFQTSITGEQNKRPDEVHRFSGSKADSKVQTLLFLKRGNKEKVWETIEQRNRIFKSIWIAENQSLPEKSVVELTRHSRKKGVVYYETEVDGKVTEKRLRYSAKKASVKESQKAQPSGGKGKEKEKVKSTEAPSVPPLTHWKVEELSLRQFRQVQITSAVTDFLSAAIDLLATPFLYLYQLISGRKDPTDFANMLAPVTHDRPGSIDHNAVLAQLKFVSNLLTDEDPHDYGKETSLENLEYADKLGLQPKEFQTQTIYLDGEYRPCQEVKDEKGNSCFRIWIEGFERQVNRRYDKTSPTGKNNKEDNWKETDSVSLYFFKDDPLLEKDAFKYQDKELVKQKISQVNPETGQVEQKEKWVRNRVLRTKTQVESTYDWEAEQFRQRVSLAFYNEWITLPQSHPILKNAFHYKTDSKPTKTAPDRLLSGTQQLAQLFETAYDLGSEMYEAHNSASSMGKLEVINKISTRISALGDPGQPQHFLLPIGQGEGNHYIPHFLLFSLSHGKCILKDICFSSKSLTSEDIEVVTTYDVTQTMNDLETLTLFIASLYTSQPLQLENDSEKQKNRGAEIPDRSWETLLEHYGVKVHSTQPVIREVNRDPVTAIYQIIQEIEIQEAPQFGALENRHQEIAESKANFYRIYVNHLVSYYEKYESQLQPKQRVQALEGILWYAEQLRQLLNDEIGIGIAGAISDHLIQFVDSKLDELKRTEALEKVDLDNLSQKMTLFSAKLAERFVDSLQLVENTKKVEASQVSLPIWQKIETVGKALKKTVSDTKPDGFQKKKLSDPKKDSTQQKTLQSIHVLLDKQGLKAYLATDYSVFDSLLISMLSDGDFENAWTTHFDLLVSKAHENLGGFAKSFAGARSKLQEKLKGIKVEASQIHADYREAISAVPATTTTTSTTAPTALPKDALKLEESTKAERAETLKQLNQLLRSARKKLNVDPLAAKTMLLGILRVIPAPNDPYKPTFWDLLEHDEITNWSTGIDELASLMFEATLKSGTFPLRPYEVFEFNVVLPLVQRYLLIRKEPFVTKQVQKRVKAYKDKTALVNELEQIERYLDGNEAPYAAKHLQEQLEAGRKHKILVQELEQIKLYLKNKKASFITEHVEKQLVKYKLHKDLIEELEKIPQLLKSKKTSFVAQHIQQRLEVHKKRTIQVKELEQIDLYLQDPSVSFFSKDVQKKLEGYDASNQALVRGLVEKRDEFVGKFVEDKLKKYRNHLDRTQNNKPLTQELERIQVYLKDKVPNTSEHVQQRLEAYKDHKALIKELEQKREAFIEMRKEEIRKRETERLQKIWDAEDKEDLKLAASYHARQAAYVAEMAAYGAQIAATPAHKQWRLYRPAEPDDPRDAYNKRSILQKREDRNAQLAREIPEAQHRDSYLTQLKNIDLKTLDAWDRLGNRHKRIQAVFGCFAKMIGIPLEELAYEKGIYNFMQELPEEKLFLMSNDSSVLIGATPEFEARFKACENAFRFLKLQNLNIDKKLLTHLLIGYEGLGNGTKVASGKPKLSVDYVIDAASSLMGMSKFYNALLTCVENQLAGFYDPSSEGHRLVCPEMRHIRKLDEMRKVLRAPERHLGTHSDGVMGAFENFLAGGNAHSAEYFKNFFSKMSSIHLVGKISTVGPMSMGTMTLSTDPSKAGSYSVAGLENFENQYLERAKFIGQKPVRMAQEKIVGDNERKKLNEAKSAPLYNSTLDPAEELMLRITNLESTHKKGSLSYLIVDECFQYMFHERKKLLIPSVQDTIYAQFFQEGLIQEALLENPGYFLNLRANLDELCSELQEQTEDNLLVLLFLREVSERIRHHAFSLREELKKYGLDWAEEISKALPEYDEKNVVGLFLQYVTSKKQKGFATYALAYYLRYIPKENDFDGWRNLLNAYYILQKSPHEVGHSGWQAELHYLVQEILLPKVELLLQNSEFRCTLLAQLTGKDPQLKLIWNREQDYQYRLENSKEIVNIRTGEGFTIQVKKGERCKLPSSVRQDPNFRFLFKELDPTVTSEEGKNDVVDYNMYDESGKHTFIFRYDKKKNAVQIFQIVDQGKFLFQKLTLSQSKRYQFWHFYAGKANYFIEDTIENRGVWIPLTKSEHVDASKVLIAQYGMDLSKDPITLWISEDRITGATIGEGEDKKWICAGLSSTDKQLLSFRTERGLLLLSKNGSEVDEIRFPVDNGSKEQLVLKKKSAGLWVKSGREHWEWQLTNTKKYEREFGKNWREYILPLKNRETGEEEIWIFPYMITQSEDGNQIKFLKSGGDFIDLLGGPISKVAGQLLKNEDLSQQVGGTNSDVRAALPSATLDDLKGLYLAVEYWMGGPSRVFEGISVFNHIVGSKHAKLDNALQQVQEVLSEIPVPTAIRYVKEKRTSKSSHAGFFYLAHAAAQRQDWGAASYYLQLMMDNGDYSSPEDVDQLRRMALMLLSAQAIGQIDLSILTDMDDMKDGVSAIFGALKKIIAPKCPLECAFRIKLTAALLTLNQQLLAQQKIQFLDTERELFIRGAGAVLHAHYIQTLPHHYRKLKENGMLVKKEEEQLLLSRPEMMLLGAAVGMVQSKESKAFLKGNNIPKELIEALNDDVKKRPPIPNLEVPIPDPLAVKEMFEVMTLFINQSASPALLPLPDLQDSIQIIKHAPAFVNQRVIQGIHQKHGHYPKWQTILSHFWHYYHWIAQTELKAEDIAFLWREIPRDPKLTDFQHRAIETARATLLLFWFYRQTETYATFRKANHLLPYATDQIERDAKRLIPNIGDQQQKGHRLREEAAKEASAFGAMNAALHTAYLLVSHFMNEWEYEEDDVVAGVERKRGPAYDFVTDSLAHFNHYLYNADVQKHHNKGWVMTPEGIKAPAPLKPIPKVETPETKALNLLKQAKRQHMLWFKNGFEDEEFETLLLSPDFEKEWQLFERKTEAAWQEKQKVASQTQLPVQTGSNRAMENALAEIKRLLDNQELYDYLATDYSVFNDTLKLMLNSPNFDSAWVSYYNTLVNIAFNNLTSDWKRYGDLAKSTLQQKLTGIKHQAAQIHATYRRAIPSTTTTTTTTTSAAPKSPQVKEPPKKAEGLDKFKAAATTIYTDYQKSLTPSEELQRKKNRVWNSFMGRLLSGVTKLTEHVENMNKAASFAEQAAKGFRAFFGANVPEESDPGKLEKIVKALKEVPRIVNEQASTIKPVFNYLITLPNFEEHFEFFEKEILSIVAKMINQEGIPLWMINWIKDYIKTAILETFKEYRETVDLPQSPYPPHSGSGQYLERVRVKPSATAYHWDMHFDDARRRYNALKGEWEMGESLWDQRMDQALKDFDPKKANTEQARYKFQKICNGIVQGNINMHTKTGSSLEVADLEKIDQKIAEAIGTLRPQQQKLYEEVLDFGKIHAVKLGISHLFADRIRITDEQILQKILDLYRYGQFDRMEDRKLQRQFAELITEFILIATEIHQYEKAIKSCKELKGVLKEIWKEIPLVFGENERIMKAQTVANQSPVWILHSAELKRVLSEGSNRLRYTTPSVTDAGETVYHLRDQKFTRRYLVSDYRNRWISREITIKALEDLLRDLREGDEKGDPIRFIRAKMGSGKSDVVFPEAIDMMIQEGLDPIMIGTAELVPDLKISLGHKVSIFEFAIDFDLTDDSTDKDIITQLIYIQKELESIESKMPDLKKAILQQNSEMQYRHLIEQKKNYLERVLRHKDFEFEEKLANIPKEYLKANNPNGSDLTLKSSREEIQAHLDHLMQELELMDSEKKLEQQKKKNKEFLTEKKQRLEGLLAEMRKNGTHTIPEEVRKDFPREYFKASHCETVIHLTALAEMLENLKIEQKAVLTSPEHIAAVRNKRVYLQSLIDSMPAGQERSDLFEQLQLVKRIEAHFKKGTYLIDEDVNFTVNFEHNLATGDYRATDITRFNCAEKLVRTIHKDHNELWEMMVQNNLRKIRDVKVEFRAVAENIFHDHEFWQRVGKEEWDLYEWSRIDEKEFIDYLLGIQENLPKGMDRWEEGEESHLKAHVAALKTFLSTTLDSVRGVNPNLERAVSSVNGVVVIPLDTDGQEKKGVLYAEESENILHHIFHYLGTGNKIGEEIFTQKYREKGTSPNRISPGYPERWLDWASDIGKYAFLYHSEYDAFIKAPELALHRFQLLRYLMLETPYIRVYHKQINFNLQHLGIGTDIRVASGTGEPFALNLEDYMSTDKTKDEDVVLGETLLCLDLTLETKPFSSTPLEHIIECAKNPECLGILNYDYEVAGNDSETLAAILRQKAPGRQIIYKNREGKKLIWNSGPQFSPMAYEPSAIDPERAFFIYLRKDSRGVHFDIPIGKGKYADAMIGTANKEDAIQQLLWRARQLGTGQTARLSCDEKTAAQIRKANGLSPTAPITQGHAMRYFTLNTLEEESITNVKAVTRKAQKPLEKHLDATIRSAYNLTKINKTDALEELESIIHSVTQDLYFMNNIISWMREYQPSNKIDQLLYVDNLYAREIRKAEGMDRKFSKEMRELVKNHPDAAILNHCDQGLFERVDLLSWIDEQIKEIFKENATKKQREKRITVLYEDVDRKIARAHADHHAPRFLGIAKEMAHKYLGIKIGVKRALTKIWEARFRLGEPRYLLNFVDQHEDGALIRQTFAMRKLFNGIDKKIVLILKETEEANHEVKLTELLGQIKAKIEKNPHRYFIEEIAEFQEMVRQYVLLKKEEATKRSFGYQAEKAGKALESVGKSFLSGFGNLFGGTNRPAATNKPVAAAPQIPSQEVPQSFLQFAQKRDRRFADAVQFVTMLYGSLNKRLPTLEFRKKLHSELQKFKGQYSEQEILFARSFANRYFEIKAEIKASGKEFATPDLERNEKYREFLVNHLPAKLVEDPNEGAGQQQKAFQMQFQKQKENVKNVQRAMHLSDRRNRTEPLNFDKFMQITRGERTVNSYAETWNRNGNCMALKDVLNVPFWIVRDAYPNCYISHRAMELLRAIGVNGYPVVSLLVIQHRGQYHSVIVTKTDIEETIAPALKKYRNGYSQPQIAVYSLSSEQTLFRSDGIWGNLPDETTRAFTHLMMINKLMLDWDKFLLEEFDHLRDWVKSLSEQDLSGWVYHFNQIGSPNSANLIETIGKSQGGNRGKSPEWLRNHVLRKLNSNYRKEQYSQEQMNALEEYVADELRGTFFDNEIHALSNKNYENSIELLKSIKSKLNRKKYPSKDPLGKGKGKEKMKEKESHYFDRPIEVYGVVEI